MLKIPGYIPAKTVDEYLSALPAAERNMLEQIRQSIKAAAPNAEEVISYNIPTYKYKGPLVHFAAFKNHCSFVVVSKTIATIFEKEIAGFENSGRTIHFTADKPIPAGLIKKIVKHRVKENEGLNPLKKKIVHGKSKSR
jgi:uncharacterized protein YdhG (YjbR/CyaY superfamily)